MTGHLTPPPGRTRPRRFGSTMTVVIAVVVITLLTVGGGMMLLGGGSRDGTSASDQRDVFTVRRGDFDVVVPTSGELAAINQIEIVNRLETRAVISYIVDEGTYVQEGDVLLRLNDEQIQEEIQNQVQQVDDAQLALRTAEDDLKILLNEHESALRNANLAVELAEIALDAWLNGEVVARREELRIAEETAQINYNRLEERYQKSKELFANKFISKDELQQDEIAYIEAEARLKQAALDIKVYETYTFEQQRKQKQSDVEQAKAERQRLIERHANERRSAEADVEAKRGRLKLARERLAKLERQLKDCTLHAPSEGLVVYASSLESEGWRRDEDPPQVGTELSRNETVMVLPDTTEMVAAVKVNEALSGMIEVGQHATVVSDALSDTVLHGEVMSIGVLAESGGWRDPNRRDYTVRIRLRGVAGLGLKPSMRCKAEIHVDRVEDALHAPIQAVFRSGGGAFVYTPADGGYAQRRVEVGRASELYVELLSGAEPGDVVLLREPPPAQVVSRLDGNEDRDEPTELAESDGAAEPVESEDSAESAPERVAEQTHRDATPADAVEVVR